MAISKTTEPASTPIPPLEQGDHLSRDEFERRYNAMPYLKKAELIEGIVYIPSAICYEKIEGNGAMASPVSYDKHGGPHSDLNGFFSYYRAFTVGIAVADNTTVRLGLDTEPQPDGLMFVKPEFGGSVVIAPDGIIEGAPELAAEVSASSVSFDLHAKLRVYQRSRVREYIVWRVRDEAIDWFVLRGDDYVPLALTPAGLYQSETFPGLWLDPAALVRGDLATVLQVLQQGIASPEHAAFVARLQQAATQPLH